MSNKGQPSLELIQESLNQKQNLIHEEAKSEQQVLRHPLKNDNNSVQSDMDRREVIPSANEEEFEEINELDKSDEEEQEDIVSEKDKSQPL